MINQEDKSKLKQIYQNYSQFHSELNSLENQLQDLLNKQIRVSQELENTRKNEKLLINKIEEDMQRTLTQEELIKIVNS
jgi:hypothetical protein